MHKPSKGALTTIITTSQKSSRLQKHRNVPNNINMSINQDTFIRIMRQDVRTGENG